MEHSSPSIQNLKIILMLPFGALAVVVFRNIVGIETFGTFMPALIAVACRDTGLAWGVTLLALILGIGAAVRIALDRFQLLHTPRLAVMLTVIVILVLAISLAGLVTGFVLPTRVSLFPPLLVQMVAVGEESNTLDFTMGVVADFFETAAEEKTSAMVGMIGPVSTIGIALLVGFIAVSVIMPMYTLTGAFG